MQTRKVNTAELFHANRTALVDYATPIVGDRTKAEDIVQEAFLRIAPAAIASGVEQPLAYVYRVVRNLALDWTRRRVVESRQQEVGQAAWWMVPSNPRTPEQDASYNEQLGVIRDVLEALPREARIAVEMHRLGGFTLQEVADHLGVSVASVHRLVRDALVQIGSRLTPPEA